MPKVNVNGIDIEYVTEGDPSDPATAPGDGARRAAHRPGRKASSTHCANAGFFVIRFDNRDSGLSTKFEGMPGHHCSLHRRHVISAISHRGHGRRCGRALGRTRACPRPRGRRLHGRHDHPGAGDQSSGPFSLRLLDHVHDGDRAVGAAHRRGDDRAAPARRRPAGKRRSRRAWRERGHRLAGVPDRRGGPRGRGPPRPTTALTAPRARPANSPPCSARPTAQKACTAWRCPSWCCTVKLIRS